MVDSGRPWRRGRGVRRGGASLRQRRTLAVLVSLFGVFALADGFFTIGAGLSLNWLSLFLEGVVGGAVGLFTFFYPPAAQVWIRLPDRGVGLGHRSARAERGRSVCAQMVTGAMARGEWLLGASGALSLIFGGLVGDARRTASRVAFVWIIGGYAIVSGGLLLALALNIRAWPSGSAAPASV